MYLICILNGEVQDVRAGCDNLLGRSRSVGVGLDIFHVVVGEAVMVADLMDQHMPDDVAQVLACLAPVIEDRPAVEEDPVEIGRV